MSPGIPAGVSAVVLAAGGATRFGSQKLIARVGAEPLVRCAVVNVLEGGIDDCIVVVGAEAAAVGAALDGLEVRLVHNRRWAEGMSTSLAAGIGAARGAVAALIVLGDQPTIPARVHRGIIDAYRALGAPIVVARYAGERGHPVLFDATVFPELVAVRGDRGARDVLARDPARVLSVDFPSSPPPDVDTPSDLATLALPPGTD
jgi:molybdenum cofactor cytidylyltransferase